MEQDNVIKTILITEAAQAIRDMKKYGTETQRSYQKGQKAVSTSAKYVYAQDKATGELIKKIRVSQKVMETNKRGFQMYWLSIMFGAMAAQRALGRVFEDWKKDFFTITENTTALGQATLRLQANMTFLSVSIMTALEPILVPLIERIIDLVYWFTSLPPEIQAVAGMFVVGGLFTTSLVMAVAQIGLFANGLMDMGVKFGLLSTDAKTGALSVTKSLDGMKTGFMNLAPWIVIAALVAYSAWKELGETLAWENKKNLAAQEKDWNKYKIYVLAQNIELTNAIPMMFERMVYTIGSIMHGMITFLGNIIFEGAKLMSGVFSILLPDQAERENWKKTQMTLIDWQTEWNKISSEVGAKATEGFLNIEGGMTKKTIQTLVDMGISMEDIVDVYGESDIVTRALSDSINGNIEKQKELTIILNEGLKPVIDNTTDSYSLMSQTINNLGVDYDSFTGKVTDSYNALEMWQQTAARASAMLGAAPVGATHIAQGIGGNISYATVPKLQTGGFIKSEGLAYLHAGETVTPKGAGMSVGNISVTVNAGPISSPADENELARKISDKIMEDIQNYTKYVPHF